MKKDFIWEKESKFIQNVLDYNFNDVYLLEDIFTGGEKCLETKFYQFLDYGMDIFNAFITKYDHEKKVEIKGNLYMVIDIYDLGRYFERRDFPYDTPTKCNLFYVLIGAVAFDSNWNINQIGKTISAIFDPDLLMDNKQNYLVEIRNFMEHCTEGEFFENFITLNSNTCSLDLDGFYYTTIGNGNTIFAARNNACKKMFYLFLNKGYIRD